MTEYQNQLCVLSVAGINAKTVGNTTLGVTENGTQRFIPLFAQVEATASSGITVAASINVGTNSTNFDNIVAGMTGPTGVNNMGNNSSAGGFSVAANTTITVRVATAATGTSQTIRVDLVGYYV